MKKLTRLLGVLFLVLTWINTNGQVKTKTFGKDIPDHLLPIKSPIGKTKVIIPPSEFYKLKQQNDIKERASIKTQLPRFSLPFTVDINFLKEALHTDSNGISVYSIIIKAPDVLNLSIEFSEFILSENSLLSIYNRYELTDSITSKENNERKTWNTRTYDGNTLNIVLKLPNKEKELVKLQIGVVYFGYKFLRDRFGDPGASESCNINVVCPAGLFWETERNSVAIIQTPNGYASGALIMNTCSSNIPYFLTANHVFEQGGNLANWVFQFFYYSTSCNSNTGFREDVQFNGAILRAAYAPSDFALLQLAQTPDANSGISYAGWNRSSNPTSSAVGLHHPNGDVMKISKSSNPVTRSGGGVYNASTHWQVIWSQGITAAGSSGSPLFDQGHRIIGQLHGGTSFCATPSGADWYGSLDQSWTGGGTDETRLSNWLDPSNSSAVSTNTTNINSLFNYHNVYNYVSGSDVLCSSTGQYTFIVNGQIYTGPVTWSSSNTSIATVSPTSNPTTVTKTGIGIVTITGTLCDGRTNSKQINVVGGSPNTTCQEIGNGTCNRMTSLCPSQLNNWQYVIIPGTWGATGTGFHLQVNGGGYFSNGLTTQDITTNSFSVYVPSGGNNTTIWAMNSCGVSQNTPYVVSFYPKSYGCYGYFKISPNPTNSSMNVSVNGDNANTAYKRFDAVRIYDQQGSLKLYRKFSKVSSATINVGSLFSGIYIVEVSSGDYKERQQLIIQK